MYEGSVEQEIRRAVGALVALDGQFAVAQAVGVAQPTISRFLLGQRRLTLSLAVGLARAYPELRPVLAALLDGREEVRV